MTVLLISCGVHEKKFDKSSWNELDDIMYTNIESMAKDLMENYLQKKMTHNELIDLIVEPENFTNTKPNTIVYEIMVEYRWDIDPVEGKNLFIELSQDSTVVDYRIEHWKN